MTLDKSPRTILGQLLSALVAAIVFLVMLPMRIGAFLLEQLSGSIDNAQRAWNYLTLDRLLPPSIVGLLQWAIETIPKLFGVRDASPWQQVGAAITLIGVAILSSFLTGGLFAFTVVIVVAMGVIGILRHIPAINEGWNAATQLLPIKRDYNVPRWKRD